MPADLLTEAEPSRLASGALAVLAGTDLQTAATGHGLDPAELSEAVQMYMAAGYAALERHTEQRWRQIFVEFCDWEQAETVAAAQLGPRLDELHRHGVIAGWWFLRKHPCWRLRLRSPVAPDPSTEAPEQIARLFTELTETRVINQWRPAIYEPEYAAFGGATAMEIVHDLFCADSRGVLEYAREDSPNIGRRELSIVLVHALLHGAGLDWFEMGDVLHRVARLRPYPPSTSLDAVDGLTCSVRTLIHIAAQNTDPKLTLKDRSESATAWRGAFRTAGRRLDAAAAHGRLDRGLRAVLSHVIIFHWNRLGLSATTQGILARAAAAAFLPPA
ncbi:thiopeptide-type bacteriocin biosynthesis protein [Actinomadura madurae]|uniref:thiopeptide-type bacteriocin biosynthesis protein n=1 Tax=Actinomadura madurae TaxID=1993 RepID=UPI0020260FA0|nr:thiopeptide-type bacteriocin biosynthesis protein [Actinomadura madurae]URM97387.1 thiopeptide-type bacteriocin biosynthesis protein [Actinomadura madurae]